MPKNLKKIALLKGDFFLQKGHIKNQESDAIVKNVNIPYWQNDVKKVKFEKPKLDLHLKTYFDVFTNFLNQHKFIQ